MGGRQRDCLWGLNMILNSGDSKGVSLEKWATTAPTE